MVTLVGVPINAACDRLLAEAHRRFVNFGHSHGGDVRRAWIGLGAPSVYAPAVRAGIMEAPPNCGKITRGIVGWYSFTSLGVAVYAAWLAAKVPAES